MNKNSMGYWLPPLVSAVSAQVAPFFKIPKTTIAQVPLPLLQLSRIDYSSLTETTIKIVNEWAKKAFGLNQNAPDGYFIKTGTYSSKYDFRNAKVTDPKEILEIGEYLLYIQHQACLMAGPLAVPSIYGVSTCREWVVRSFISDQKQEGDQESARSIKVMDSDRPLCSGAQIYHGLQLRNELRVFVDFDTCEVLGIFMYWDPGVMKQRFGHEQDADEPDKIHDYIIYSAFEQELKERFEQTKDLVTGKIRELLPSIRLRGQWSIDIMEQNVGDQFGSGDFYIIDMALAQNSAFYDRIPKELRRPEEEKWLPEIKK